MSAGESFVQLEQAWRFQELVGDSYLELCAGVLRRQVSRLDYLVVEIDLSEGTTNLLYWLASWGVRSDIVYPGGTPAARLSVQPTVVAAVEAA